MTVEDEWMAAPTPAERRMYADLTHLLADLKNASLMDVSEAIETRYRSFLESGHHPNGGELQITMTWCLPEGADGLALYRTEYRTAATAPLPDESQRPQCRSETRPPAKILIFPRR
jgi:hypothetical protein